MKFYEFFAGGGMARAGLGPTWECLFANDFDSKKAASYETNWGHDMHCADIWSLKAAGFKDAADLAWASFPCQDLSLAGVQKGLEGGRSGAFWAFHKLMRDLGPQRPTTLVLENVVGMLTSNKGEDFRLVIGALAALGYRVGALMIDAKHFVPQSRPRLFIVASIDPHFTLTRAMPDYHSGFHPRALIDATRTLSDNVMKQWVWWSLPHPPRRNMALIDIIEDEPIGVEWHTREQQEDLLGKMGETNRAKLDHMLSANGPKVGTVYRRTRTVGGKKVVRAELRDDGLAGCLRTPGGGSSRQFVLVVKDGEAHTRLLSPREAARLMGLPDSYVLPANYHDALHLLGDGLAVPAVNYLARHLLDHLAVRPVPLTVAA